MIKKIFFCFLWILIYQKSKLQNNKNKDYYSYSIPLKEQLFWGGLKGGFSALLFNPISSPMTPFIIGAGLASSSNWFVKNTIEAELKNNKNITDMDGIDPKAILKLYREIQLATMTTIACLGIGLWSYVYYKTKNLYKKIIVENSLSFKNNQFSYSVFFKILQNRYSLLNSTILPSYLQNENSFFDEPVFRLAISSYLLQKTDLTTNTPSQ